MCVCKRNRAILFLVCDTAINNHIEFSVHTIRSATARARAATAERRSYTHTAVVTLSNAREYIRMNEIERQQCRWWWRWRRRPRQRRPYSIACSLTRAPYNPSALRGADPKQLIHKQSERDRHKLTESWVKSLFTSVSLSHTFTKSMCNWADWRTVYLRPKPKKI